MQVDSTEYKEWVRMFDTENEIKMIVTCTRIRWFEHKHIGAGVYADMDFDCCKHNTHHNN